MKVGDKVRTTDKYNATLSSYTNWARIDLGEIIGIYGNGNIAQIKLIKSKNKHDIDFYGIDLIEKISCNQ
jgi:hypothetical protein